MSPVPGRLELAAVVVYASAMPSSRTEDEFITRVKTLLADEHERPETAFDPLVPLMRAAYEREGGIEDGDLEIIIRGCDDESLTDRLADRYPLTNEIAASLQEDDGDEDEDEDGEP